MIDTPLDRHFCVLSCLVIVLSQSRTSQLQRSTMCYSDVQAKVVQCLLQIESSGVRREEEHGSRCEGDGRGQQEDPRVV